MTTMLVCLIGPPRKPNARSSDGPQAVYATLTGAVWLRSLWATVRWLLSLGPQSAP
jgi:hypothetical protein